MKRGAGLPLFMALCALGGGAVLLASAPQPVYRDVPPPGYSGGFGEQSCDACHFFNEVNDPAGSLTLAGIPDRYSPGEAYRIEVILTRPGMAIGGFQLTARFEDGAQAGLLAPVAAEGERLAVTTSRNVQYAHHLLPGTELVAMDTARWILIWTAPDRKGTVLFPASANAADGDDTVSGDYVYSVQSTSRPIAE